MQERLLDVVKWGLVLVIAGAVFYVVYPKYYFKGRSGSAVIISRGNKVTGLVERYRSDTGWDSYSPVQSQKPKEISEKVESLEGFEKRYRKEKLKKVAEIKRSTEEAKIRKKVNAEIPLPLQDIFDEISPKTER